MPPISDRKAIADAIFSITGDKVAASDPVVTAALFYAHQVREAGRQAALEITVASTAALDAAKIADGALKQLAREREKLASDLETRVQKCLRLAKSHPGGPNTGSALIPAWYALAALICGLTITLCAGAWPGGFIWGHSQEAAIGRSFVRALRTLDPDVKAKLIEHMRKHAE